MELKTKALQLISHIASDDDKADVYATIVMELLKLAYDYNRFFNTPNFKIHKEWAFNVIHSGNSFFLNEQINQITDDRHFLPDKDYLCYAYEPDDSNDHKYARISLLEFKIGNDVNIEWDLPSQGSLDNNLHIA